MTKVTLGYKTVEAKPIQLYFLSFDPITHFERVLSIENGEYFLSSIEKVEVVKMPSMFMIVTSSMTILQQRKRFNVANMDDVFNAIELEDGVNEMFLHKVDIAEN